MTKFNWNSFGSDFLSEVVYSSKTDKEIQPMFETRDVNMLIPSVLSIAETPDREFVMKYRDEIEFKLLKNYPDLVREITGASKTANYLSELNKLSQEKMTNGLADKYIKALYRIGCDDFVTEFYSEFRNVRTVNLQSQDCPNPIILHDYQQEAVTALKEYFIDDDEKSGLLVMPTGSGKTRTSTAFLLNHMVAEEGYQIIWLTHRHMLIDQAAKSFYVHSPTIKLYNTKMKQFKMVCVSGNHKTMKATEKDDNLMILSVQSASRNLDYLKTVLSKKVVIVVDEAHHAVAKSYRKIINYVRKRRPDAKLLGLTATPVRDTDAQSRYLLSLFDNKIVYSISMSQLIKDKYLAKPEYIDVQTGENFETFISLDEEKYIKRWGELPESLVDKVAKSSERNKVIVQHYLDNKGKYGKTLIFALNAYHAYTLTQEMRKSNVRCDFVYSRRGKEKNEVVIHQFQEGKLDVLININILTEGSDIPDIQTVFLTRPTASDVLLMQMIGRGMRGISAQGTETIYLVDFVDKWETFNKWLNPKYILEDEVININNETATKRRKPHLIPWGMVQDIYSGLSIQGGKIQANIATPYGWFRVSDDVGEDYVLLVFEDQYERYLAIHKDRHELKKENITISKLRKIYFSGFVLPPSDYDLQLFWDNICDDGDDVHFFLFEDRDKYDHIAVARMIKETDANLFRTSTDLYNSYDVVKELYGNLQNYRFKIFDALNREEQVQGNKVEELPIELLPYIIDKPYDLQKLTAEVIDEMFNGNYQDFNISWTDRPCKDVYGRFYKGIDKDNIVINVLLNSSQVKPEVVKYVIYHEMLHRFMRYHDEEFRREEHKYPNYTEWERVLDHQLLLNYKFEW